MYTWHNNNNNNNIKQKNTYSGAEQVDKLYSKKVTQKQLGSEAGKIYRIKKF